MQFDIFHSLGRIDSITPRLSDREVFQNFFTQVTAAEKLGYETVWVAESHFSSEIQKSHIEPVIPNYRGEVGLNADSMQLAQAVFAETEKINFGTAIHNIVGGNGGPIASADRVQTLAFLNSLSRKPRKLYIGVASGRFPYINEPFGISPRSPEEAHFWPQYKRLIFLEALEIFMRLLQGETIRSDDVTSMHIDHSLFSSHAEWKSAISQLGHRNGSLGDMIEYKKRWTFQRLKLVPELSSDARQLLTIVLGSHDPLARDLAFKWGEVDVFNLSFTPVEKINQIHKEMEQVCGARIGLKSWARSRLPRTVLVFIDRDASRARRKAEACFDTYIEAMRGTVALPSKEVLMSKALVGTPNMIREMLDPQHPLGFQLGDRLMLWFEFNQSDCREIVAQMELFATEVMG